MQATLALPVAVVANILVARFLGPIQFGYLATLMAVYGIALGIANAGVSDATIQWGAAAHVHRADEDLVALVRRSSGYHVLVELPLMVAVTAVLLRNTAWSTQLAACLAVAITMFIGTATVVQTLRSRTATIARVALVTNVALQVAVIVGAEASRSGYVTWAVRLAVANLAPLALLMLLPGPLRSAVLRPSLPLLWPEGFVPFAVKTAILGVTGVILFSRSEVILLQVQHQRVAAGVYALAFGVAAHMTAPIDAVLGPMQPAAASLAEAAPERIADAVARGLKFTAVATGAIAAFGVPVVSALAGTIFGSAFDQVGKLILPLALLSCVQSLGHPIAAFLLYGVRSLVAPTLVNAVAIAFDLGLAAATIATLHAWGATIGNGAGQLIALAGAMILLRRKLSLRARTLLQPMRTFFQGAAAATAGWLVVELAVPPGWSPGAAAALGFLTGGALFLALQRLSAPAFTREDMTVFVHGLPPAARGPVGSSLAFFGFAPRLASE